MLQRHKTTPVSECFASNPLIRRNNSVRETPQKRRNLQVLALIRLRRSGFNLLGRRGLAAGVDPEKLRARESLRLAKAELTRQLENTTHPIRQQQIEAAVAELDRRLAAI